MLYRLRYTSCEINIVISSTLERVSKAALLDSYRIWLGREGNVGSGEER
jgi:hypothetical protein